MAKQVIIHDDRIELLRDGYNIIEMTVYEPEIVKQFNELLEEIDKKYGHMKG